MIQLTAEEAAAPWRFWLAIAVLVLAGLGGVVALTYEPPAPADCVVVVGAEVQELCPDDYQQA